jgi:hypothetical protein
MMERTPIKREYLGQEIAAPLVQWLNNPKEANQHRGVLGLIAAEEELRRTHTRMDRARIIGKLNDILSGFGSFYPLIADNQKVNVLQIAWQANEQSSAANYAHCWLRLLGKNLLPQLKRCLWCHKFFFARFQHHDFDRVACRDRFKQNNPLWLEHRRKWEREYYHVPKNKEKKKRARQRARARRRTGRKGKSWITKK